VLSVANPAIAAARLLRGVRGLRLEQLRVREQPSQRERTGGAAELVRGVPDGRPVVPLQRGRQRRGQTAGAFAKQVGERAQPRRPEQIALLREKRSIDQVVGIELDRARKLRIIVFARRQSSAQRSIPSARRSPVAHEDLIRRLFGLSPAQARLTALLVGGRSVKEAAGALGIAESSARQYLKVVFSKTGTRGQADLVRMVGSVLLLQV
jgi:DNA-binding CsgD family transcriptional regulator